MAQAALRPTTKPTTIAEMVREYRTCFQAGEEFAKQADPLGDRAERRADRQMCAMIEHCDKLRDLILATPVNTLSDLAVKRRFVEKDAYLDQPGESVLVDIILKLDTQYLRSAAAR